MKLPSLVSLVLLAACSAAPPAPVRETTALREPATAEREDWTVHDTMPVFFSFWEQTQRTPRSEWRALFLEQVAAGEPALYGPSVLGLPDDDSFEAARDARIEGWLDTLPPLVGTMRSLHETFSRSLVASRARIRAALPDFAWSGRVVLFANVGSFNAGVRRVGDDAPLLFGIDTFAAFGQTDPLSLDTTLAHELFHMHQAERDERLFTALWVEGLATYASIELTPGANDAVALPFSHLHDPSAPVLDARDRRVSLADEMPRHAGSLGVELLRVLTSTDEADYAQFFLGRAAPQLGARPVRSGYWFGLEVVRRVANGRPLRELAHVPPGELEDEIRAALETIVADPR